MRPFIALLFVLSLSACFGMGSRAPAPVVHHGQKSGAGSAGIHNVISGDTLYSVSNRYHLAMRDIVALNRLKPPFVLHEGQRLKLPPPQEYRVRHGDTLYGVSRLFGVNSSEIARLNNINAPYVVRPGDVLRLPSITRKSRIKSKPPIKQTILKPEKKPAPAEVRDGVPLPQNKPQNIKVSKVTTKAPKRASGKFLRPVRGKIISNYGAKKSGLHNDGINIAAAKGTPVKAAENGVVVYAGNALKGSGNLILVRHESQWMTAYAHLDRISVGKGKIVKRNSTIGTVGSTGSVSTPQLHFEVRRGTSAMNPVKYME